MNSDIRFDKFKDTLSEHELSSLGNSLRSRFSFNPDQKIRGGVCVDHFPNYIGTEFDFKPTKYNEATDPNKCFHYDLDKYEFPHNIVDEMRKTWLDLEVNWQERCDLAVVEYLCWKYGEGISLEGLKKVAENTNNFQLKGIHRISQNGTDTYTDGGETFLIINNRDKEIFKYWEIK